MTSKSRAAQQALSELEKSSANFEDQLVEAAKFIGTSVDALTLIIDVSIGVPGQREYVGSHGKEEWLLKWLLKRLQPPKDDIPRRTANSWRLLFVLLQRLPLSTSAKVLGERRVLSILQETLDGIKQLPVGAQNEETIKTGESEGTKKSKKRKRENAVVEVASFSGLSVHTLLASILRVVDFLVKSALGLAQEETGNEYSAEYMRTVLRVKSEDAAKLFGAWLTVLQSHNVPSHDWSLPWLGPFAEIWQLRVVDENYLMHFSLHCTLPLLSLRTSLFGQSQALATQIDQLVSRNIILPSKSARAANTESTTLADLTKLAIISDSMNSSYLFEVAIRSIQPQGSKRRQPVDEAWLQLVFRTLIAALPRKREQQNVRAVCLMLEFAMAHKVNLELDDLRSITSEFGFAESETRWELLSLTTRLDANVFLIPNTEKDLLQELLTRINQASLSGDWDKIGTSVVEDVIIPLMGEFSKARDLTGFLHHWLAQLIEVENSRHVQNLPPVEEFGAWEDGSLQKALQKLLESSLSTSQVEQLLVWLDEQAISNIGPVSVILQAISGALSREEYVDAVGLKCYRILFEDQRSEKIPNRYKWRSWSVLSSTVGSASSSSLEEITQLWLSEAQPFDRLKSDNHSMIHQMNSSNLRICALEFWRFACTAASIAKDSSKLEELAGNLLHDLNKTISGEVASLIKILRDDLSGKIPSGAEHTSRIQLVLSFSQTLLVDCPRALVISARDPTFNETLKNIFWIASAAEENFILRNSNGEYQPEEFANNWMTTLRHDIVLNTPVLSEAMVDIMLDEVEHISNPLVKEDSVRDSLAIRVLLQLPISILHRKHRERIMRNWIPFLFEDKKHRKSRKIKWTDPTVLALKIKFMRFPMFYEDMEFKHLEYMAKSIETSDLSKQATNLQLFKEFVRLTLEFVFANPSQARNQSYLKHAIKFIKKADKGAESQDSSNYEKSSVILLSSVLRSIRSHSAALHENGLLKEKEVPKFGSRLEQAILRQSRKSFDALTSSEDLVSAALTLRILLASLQDIGSTDTKQDLAVRCRAILHIHGAALSIDLKTHLDLFVAQNRGDLGDGYYPNFYPSDITTVDGRKAIRERVLKKFVNNNSSEELKMLEAVFSEKANVDLNLGQLYAVRQVILSMKDNRKSQTREDDDDSSDDEDTKGKFNISAAFSLLCAQLPRSAGVRQFSIISKTMAMMLKTKARFITQWNIDSTLAAISSICSRHGPKLRVERASTIYLHLCQLLQAILTTNRLKLEGHFHLVVQALQSLIRCLFVPLAHSSSKTLKAYAPPPWLPTTPSTYSLNATHAAAFARLITLICDPSVSSVTRAKHNVLTSATDKAKRMAGPHMVFVLMSYVRLQLDMRMVPGMRERMTPGLYAIFDITTVELRRAVSEGLDASGRAVFGVLYKDYLKFGKWKGS